MTLKPQERQKAAACYSDLPKTQSQFTTTRRAEQAFLALEEALRKASSRARPLPQSFCRPDLGPAPSIAWTLPSWVVA